MKFQDIELKYFFDLSLDDKLLILDWRNDVNVRKWMYSPEIISEVEHLEFIGSLQYNAEKQYFLVSKENKKIGVIYFTNINHENKSAEIGLYSNPELSGMGSLLMDSVLRYAFDKLHFYRLIAEAFIENDRAINLYKKFNFKENKTKIVNNKEVIAMELKNENY